MFLTEHRKESAQFLLLRFFILKVVYDEIYMKHFYHKIKKGSMSRLRVTHTLPCSDSALVLQ